jgi:hypothetical protein
MGKLWILSSYRRNINTPSVRPEKQNILLRTGGPLEVRNRKTAQSVLTVGCTVDEAVS